jgi:putative transposase
MLLSATGHLGDSDLRSLAAHYCDVSVDSFVVMPNHVHAILAIGGAHVYSPNSRQQTRIIRNLHLADISPKAGSLSAVVRSYKAGVTRHCHELGMVHFAWQSGFYEHVVRTSISLNAIRDYIEKNPANWPHDPESIDEVAAFETLQAEA